MTTYTIKTHRHEANAIERGDKMFIMRSMPMPLNSRIVFQVIENGKRIPHAIDDRLYVASYIDSGEPIQDGIYLIGIKRLK